MVKGHVGGRYYSSKEGLAEELGWHGNTFLAEFKGYSIRSTSADADPQESGFTT
jgi:hypothetical protein